MASHNPCKRADTSSRCKPRGATVFEKETSTRFCNSSNGSGGGSPLNAFGAKLSDDTESRWLSDCQIVSLESPGDVCAGIVIESGRPCARRTPQYRSGQVRHICDRNCCVAVSGPAMSTAQPARRSVATRCFSSETSWRTLANHASAAQTTAAITQACRSVKEWHRHRCRFAMINTHLVRPLGVYGRLIVGNRRANCFDLSDSSVMFGRTAFHAF